MVQYGGGHRRVVVGEATSIEHRKLFHTYEKKFDWYNVI